MTSKPHRPGGKLHRSHALGFAAAVCLALLATSTLAADDCTDEVRLDQPNSPFGYYDPPDEKQSFARAMPVRSQADRGICYAYAGAGLVDAWRFTHEPTKWKRGEKFHLTSPFPAAVGASLERGMTKKFEGGAPEEAVDWLRKNNGCDHEAFFAADKTGTLHENEYIKKLEAAWDAYNKYEKDVGLLHAIWGKYGLVPRAKWDADMIRLYDQYLLERKLQDKDYASYFFDLHYTHGASPIARDLHCSLLKENFPEGSIPTYVMRDTNLLLAALLRKPSKVEFLKAYFAQVCKKPEHKIDLSTVPAAVSEPKDATYNPGDGKLARAAINRQLSQPNPQPVAITFCPSILEDSSKDWWREEELSYTFKSTGRKVTTKVKNCTSHDPKDPSPKTSHVVLVVGRRPHPTEPGKCQFRLRNSWGQGCAKYESAGWTDCQKGDLWIDSDRLAANTFKVTYLKK